MSSTIESTNNTILQKISYLFEAINYLGKYLPIKNENRWELQRVSDEYELGSVKILSDYFLLIKNYKRGLKSEIDAIQGEVVSQAARKESFAARKANFNRAKDNFFKNYQIFIRKENFLGKLNRMYNIIKNITQSAVGIGLLSTQDFYKVRDIMSKYTNLTITFTFNLVSYIKCSICDRDMTLISASSEIICTLCGLSEVLIGTVFEDEQFYYQEGQRTKHGSYEPSKHCKFWIERLQAKESKSIPDTIIKSVKECIKRDNIRHIEDISYEEIRKYLSYTKNTSYNEHVPLIRKIITGISPPQLTDKEIQVIVLIFNKAKKIYEEVKPEDKTNIKYYPYLIYKIIEYILRDAKCTKRRNGILSAVHLQSVNTLISNDEIWVEVCLRLNIDYIPTDRNKDLD